ncbi:MAG TPA: DUF6259 domain-containing protein [Paludibacter sp.]|nr:DUF6259 domain-containing protein [Paludibacter sp.]
MVLYDNQNIIVKQQIMRTRFKLNVISLLLIIFSINGVYGQLSTVNNSKVLFEINDEIPIKLQNKINNTKWNISQDKLYNVLSKNTSNLVNTLSVKTNSKSQAVLSLAVKNNSNEAIEVTVNFPIINGVHFSKERSEELYYLYPKEGWASNNEDAEEDNFYGRWFPLQFVDIYDKDNGGFYVMTNDTTNYPKKYYFKKKDGKIDLKVTYQTKKLMPGEVWNLPPTVLGTHTGDWHEGFYAYKDWVQTWYKPIAPRKQWFQDIYNFRQVFLHTFFGEEGFWNPLTKKIDLLKEVEDAEKAFGGVDYVHIFDWMREPEDRIYNYNPWNYIGGYQQLKEQIATLKKRGIRTGLYYQGYKLHRESDMGIKHGKDWEMLNPQGENYGEKGYHYPCPSAPGWQEYFTDVAKKITDLLGTDGVYFDQYGFGYLTNYNGCYNTEHKHPGIEGPIKPNYIGIGEINMWKKLRTKISNDIVTYNEEMPTDVGTQYLDGTYTYAINKSGFTPTKNPSSVNLFRFLFPGFKIIEMLAVDRPFDDNVTTQLKNVFFNGEGIFLQGPLNDTGWFTDEARYVIRKTHAILSSNKEAFRSDDAMPLVKTEDDSIHANYFPSPRKNVWTLFNVGSKDYSGNVLLIPHIQGAYYYDAWNLIPVTPVIKDGYALVKLNIKSNDAGCLIQSLDKVTIAPPAPFTKTVSKIEEKISIETTSSILEFKVAAGGTGSLYVDWGNGKLIEYEVKETLNNPTEIKGPVLSRSKTVKIYTKDKFVTYFYCPSNKITDLNISKEPMLSYLHCFNNNIREIDTSKNIELILLRCQSNQLTYLDLINNIKLRDLQINGNNVSEIKGLENLYILKTLVTSGNPLMDINLSGNPNLETLNVRNSGLTQLDLSKNKKIKMVDIINTGPTNKNVFSASALNKLYNSLPDRSNGETFGEIKVIYSLSNPLFNDGKGSDSNIARDKKWKVVDSTGNSIL